MSNFAEQKGKKITPKPNAKIDQLVDHDLAKVGVEGSSPVFRSREQWNSFDLLMPASKANHHAKIAQLVEHDLAKVGVAGSSPVFRSKYYLSRWRNW